MVAAQPSIALITASTRTPRIGPSVSALIQSLLTPLASSANVTLSPVDLATFNLPVFDEPAAPAMVPAKASHVHDHTKRWSGEIAKHDAYVLVIPEYNYGMAGATKNAVDYLYNEWSGKPALIVSYGIMGGKNAGEQLKQALECQKLRVVATRPALVFDGGVGPNVFAAMAGELKEEQKKDWEEKFGDEVKAAFGELKKLMDEPKEEPKEESKDHEKK